MSFTVITNPDYLVKIGFTNAQFKLLDGLYLRAASHKALNYRTVDCDFDEGVVRYTYFKAEGQAPLAQFVIRKAGPRAMLYEVYTHGKGRIARSGVFERAYDHLRGHIESLL